MNFRLIDLLKNLFRHVTSKQIRSGEDARLLVLVSSILLHFRVSLNGFDLLHLHLFDNGWRLFFVLFDHIDVVYIVLADLTVDNLLELTQALLGNQLNVEFFLKQLVSFEPFKNLARVLVIEIGSQMYSL